MDPALQVGRWKRVGKPRPEGVVTWDHVSVTLQLSAPDGDNLEEEELTLALGFGVSVQPSQVHWPQ